MNRQAALQKLKKAKRAVVKVGTSLLTDGHGGLNLAMLQRIKDSIQFLESQSIETILVSSGAVGMGRSTLRDLGLKQFASKNGMSRRQAHAAIGQARLMEAYRNLFHERPVAQLLLTARDFRDRTAYLNIGRTLNEIIELGGLPIINENDTVSTEELKFGDNDLLSAACASLFRANLLIILTSADGFLVDGKRQSMLNRISNDELSHAKGPAAQGSGGMLTKLRAGQLCLLTGEVTAILPGFIDRPIESLWNEEDTGTLIASNESRVLSARKRWLLFARAAGKLTVDAGAAKALVDRGSSLLSAGIVRTKGRFFVSDVVDIETEGESIIGRGIVNYNYRELEPMLKKSSKQLRELGLLRQDEVIHRNNLILE